jgi:hypothetical protein
LGNISPGETVEDTYYAVFKFSLPPPLNKNIAVILGGGQDLTYITTLLTTEQSRQS